VDPGVGIRRAGYAGSGERGSGAGELAGSRSGAAIPKIRSPASAPPHWGPDLTLDTRRADGLDVLHRCGAQRRNAHAAAVSLRDVWHRSGAQRRYGSSIVYRVRNRDPHPWPQKRPATPAAAARMIACRPRGGPPATRSRARGPAPERGSEGTRVCSWSSLGSLQRGGVDGHGAYCPKGGLLSTAPRGPAQPGVPPIDVRNRLTPAGRRPDGDEIAGSAGGVVVGSAPARSAAAGNLVPAADRIRRRCRDPNRGPTGPGGGGRPCPGIARRRSPYG
jgi:hypothetical protein